MTCRGAGALAAGAVLVLVVATALASPSDGTVLGATRVVDRGPPAERFNVVLLAEGFRNAERDAFAAHVDDFVAALFASAPFDDCGIGVNVWRSRNSEVERPSLRASLKASTGVSRMLTSAQQRLKQERPL